MRWKLHVFALYATAALCLLFLGWYVGLLTADYLHYHNH